MPRLPKRVAVKVDKSDARLNRVARNKVRTVNRQQAAADRRRLLPATKRRRVSEERVARFEKDVRAHKRRLQEQSLDPELRALETGMNARGGA